MISERGKNNNFANIHIIDYDAHNYFQSNFLSRLTGLGALLNRNLETVGCHFFSNESNGATISGRSIIE